MSSAAPSGGGGGDDKPPESAPPSLTSPDPPADPPRNGEPPAPVASSGDDDMSRMGMMTLAGDDDVSTMGMTAKSGDDDTSTMGTAECGAKRPLPSRPTPCRRCARRKTIQRGIDPGPQSEDELSALPSALASPVPGTGMELPDPRALGTNGSPSAAGWCASCEFRKKVHRDRQLRRNSQVPAPPSLPIPFPLLDDESLRVRPRPAKKRPLSVEEERGYRECDVGKKLMRHKWDGLHHKWARHRLDSVPAVPDFDHLLEKPGFGAAAGGRDLLPKVMLDVQKKLAPLQGEQKPGIGAAAGQRVPLLDMMMQDVQKPGFGAVCEERDLLDLLDMMMLDVQKKMEAQNPGFDAAAGVHDVLEKIMLDVQKKLAPLQGAQKPGFGAAGGARDLLDMMMLDVQKKLAPLQGPQKPVFGAVGGERDLLDMMMLDVQKKLAPLQGAQNPGFGAAAGERDLLDMMMLGVQKKLEPLQGAQKPGFSAAAGGHDLLEKMMLDVQKLAPLQGAQKPGFGAVAGGHDLLEKMMLQKALHVDDARLALQQEAQNPNPSAAARVDALHQKLVEMSKVLTKVLHDGCVLQVSTKLIRVLCPDVGFRAAEGGGLDASDWALVEEAIDNLVNQTGGGIQDIVKAVIPKVFSKEILYDLIMACIGQYPKLLQDDKGKLTQEKHKKYQKQLDLMVNLTMVYDNDPENFSKIMKLMCKIGECGPLPREVIDDISPGFDPSTMEQLYTGMVELLHNVDRASSVDANPTSK